MSNRPEYCGGCGETDPEKRCIGCLADFGPGLISEGEAEVLDGTSLRAKIAEIGNQVHNLGCEYQNYETLSARLSEIRSSLWEISQQAPTAPQPGQPDLEERIDNAVQAMAETHSTWESRCHAIMAALGFNFGWDEPQHDDAQAHIAALTAKVESQKSAGYCDAQYLSDGPPFKCGWQHRAETAEARVAQLEESLEPFAKEADRIEDLVPSAGDDMILYPSQNVSVGEFRRARAALGGQSNVIKLIQSVQKVAEADISMHAKGGKFASGLANEGFAGGYLSALRDVEAALIHGYPNDTCGYWSRAALHPEKDGE